VRFFYDIIKYTVLGCTRECEFSVLQTKRQLRILDDAYAWFSTMMMDLGKASEVCRITAGRVVQKCIQVNILLYARVY